MSIASQIAALTEDRNAIREALVEQGVEEAANHGFDDFAEDIAGLMTLNNRVGYGKVGTLHLEFDGSSAATITSTKPTQTIASGTYLTGTQTIAAIPAAYQDVTGVTATASDVVSGKDIVNSSGAVVHGSLVIQSYYTGSDAPSSSTGVNGDIYLQTS